MSCRYGATVTSTYTPSCFMVAVSSGAATTALSDVDECSTGKRKKRKRSLVEDQPYAPTLEEVILPSRYIILRDMFIWHKQEGEKQIGDEVIRAKYKYEYQRV